MRRLAIALLLVACAPPPSLVSGPYGGATHRFYVDELVLPQAGQLAFDVDGVPHDQLGNLVSLLHAHDLASQSVAQQLASGALGLQLELITEDAALRNDARVGVRLIGAPAVVSGVAGATLRDGRLRTNRLVALTAPLPAALSLPLFVDADAVRWPLVAFELDLMPDGLGGFDGTLHAAAPLTPERPDVLDQSYAPLVQAIAAHPDAHQDLIHLLDVDRDGQISPAELATNPWLRPVLAADAWLLGQPVLTLGVALHLSPCGGADCRTPPAPPRCDDRVQNGDESDVDCGGSCARCAAALACAGDDDCLSGACRAGRCAAPTCSDGRRDGFETDVDCGPGCTLCGVGRQCWDDGDCLSGSCLTRVCRAEVHP